MTVDEIKDLIRAVSDSKLDTLEYRDEQTKLILKKNEKENVLVTQRMAVATDSNATSAAALVSVADGDSLYSGSHDVSGQVVTSPLVGTVYMAPSEGAEPYVNVGDSVKKGQVLAIVEAMKLMNEIESEYDGVIQEIMVENGQTVEYGQPLFKIG